MVTVSPYDTNPGLCSVDIPFKMPAGLTLTLKDGTQAVLVSLPFDFELRLRAAVERKLRAAHPDAEVMRITGQIVHVEDEFVESRDTDVEIHVVYRPHALRRICPTCMHDQPYGPKKPYRPFECVWCGHAMPKVPRHARK